MPTTKQWLNWSEPAKIYVSARSIIQITNSLFKVWNNFKLKEKFSTVDKEKQYDTESNWYFFTQ